ncbi:MAG: 3-polyprenyl-4-hydroxybenzoate decarboxylase [Cenarchaeum symbiont of Oopsacas minuta]|nr:3-polyprenyl-4-hydroxybenzoate decarboxylase [Cenarchaeum symbiont of Oopsacas minuta]
MFDLRKYLATVSKTKDVRIIKKRVSTKYEIAAITAKLDGREALIFQNVENTKFSIVSNLVGTRKRFAQAVKSKPEYIHQTIAEAIKKSKKPNITKSGKFMENSSRDLSILPIIKHYEKESGPFITSSIVYAKNPETGEQNSSFHRIMPMNNKHMTIRMVEDRHLHRCFMYAKKHGEDLRVAITIGVHPAVSIAGAYQEKWGKDEMGIANSLLGYKLKVAKCPYSGMHVPFDAEIVIEGRIMQDKVHSEWMVEMLRTYDHKRLQPVIELDRVYFRNNPLFHDILSGYAEHRLLMGMPAESKLNIMLKKSFSVVRKVSLTDGGSNWMHAVVQLGRKAKLGEPKKIIKETFKIHRSLKRVTIVDSDINLDSAVEVEYAIATRFQADKDLVILKNIRGSSLDPSSNQKTLKTAKIGIDATMPLGKRLDGFELAKIPFIDKVNVTKL